MTTFDAKFIAAQLALAELAEIRIARAVDEVIGNYPAALREIQTLRGAMNADDQRLIDAAEKAGITFYGCDTADVLAEEVLKLRKENERLRVALTWYAENTDVLTDPNGKRAREAWKAVRNELDY